jgi:hypothetical protein
MTNTNQIKGIIKILVEKMPPEWWICGMTIFPLEFIYIRIPMLRGALSTGRRIRAYPGRISIRPALIGELVK